MKLMYSPGACSVGIHVLLEEIGKPYQTQLVNLAEGAQYKADFTSVNPKSKVPTLVRDDGSVLTEFPAIAYWLARTNPQSKLLPEDAEHQARVLEAMDYVVSTVHMRGFTRVFRPGNFSSDPAEEGKVKELGKEIAVKGFEILDKTLAGKDYVIGAFSIADAALFFVEFWGAARVKMTLPSNCAAHYKRMLARPAVQRTMQAEGLQS